MSVKKSLKNKKLWGGRFEEATSPFVERFTSSVSFDNSLYQYDIDGSIAHAKMLEKVGTLDVGEEHRARMWEEHRCEHLHT